MTSEDQSDVLLGGIGDDFIEGNEANDYLSPGAFDGLDVGASSSDIFVFALGDGDDIITDFDAFEDQIDLSPAGITNTSEITANNTGTDLIIEYGFGGDRVVLANVGPDLDETDIGFIFA